MTNFSGSYNNSEVEILLKPTLIPHVSVEEKEVLIGSGKKHYSEMLSKEEIPDSRYFELYNNALVENAGILKADLEVIAKLLSIRDETHKKCVLVSLARAGTPIGVLLRYELTALGIDAPHYSISIIRGRGIDMNALRYIIDKHGKENIVFVDGWTGKGAIRDELDKSLEGTGVKPFLVVVADPAGKSSLAATTEDYVIPSGMLNGVVSGLISRSVLNDELVGPDDYHACLYMEEYRDIDKTRHFIDTIISAKPTRRTDYIWSQDAATEAMTISKQVIDSIGISDVNRIKPGIAESTRAILRRVPEHLFVSNKNDPAIKLLLHLSEKHGIAVIEKDIGNYKSMVIIKDMSNE